MEFGIKTPSLKGRISARTSIKRQIVHRAALKMPIIKFIIGQALTFLN
jgi:hypothetical protein